MVKSLSMESKRLVELQREVLIELVKTTKESAALMGDQNPISLMANLNFGLIQWVENLLKAWRIIQIAFVTGTEPDFSKGFKEGGN